MKTAVRPKTKSLKELAMNLSPAPRAGLSYYLDSTHQALAPRGDPLTYLNKDQFYGLTLEFDDAGQARPPGSVRSVIMLQLRERTEPEEAVQHWEFWQSRQHSSKLRLLDVDYNGSVRLLDRPDNVAHNAVSVTWNPSEGPAHVMLSVRCLSTDFSSQKGVKGIPLHIQVWVTDQSECCVGVAE